MGCLEATYEESKLLPSGRFPRGSDPGLEATYEESKPAVVHPWRQPPRVWKLPMRNPSIRQTLPSGVRSSVWKLPMRNPSSVAGLGFERTELRLEATYEESKHLDQELGAQGGHAFGSYL